MKDKNNIEKIYLAIKKLPLNIKRNIKFYFI